MSPTVDQTPSTLPDVVELVADTGSIQPWRSALTIDDPMSFTDRRPYADRLAQARRETGAHESVWTGRVTIDGNPAAVIASNFAFLAGTMGLSAALRITEAFDRAIDERLPVIGMPTSGGTRMQEGTPAFVQMAAVSAAVRRLRDARLPYLVWLRNPTTGGVLASWGSLGHVTFAEPGALIGLTGPRVIAALAGQQLPEGTQTAENLVAHGILDGIVDRDQLRNMLATALEVLAPAEPSAPDVDLLALDADATIDPWAAVSHSRRVDRPGVRDLFAACVTHATRLSGDGVGGRDDGLIAAIARVQGIPAVIIAADKPPGQPPARLTAAGYRTARRAMSLADELDLPLVTVIDTAGADISVTSEEEGLAAEVARCLAELAHLRVPTLSLLFGQGTGGGAMALLPADRVIACEHAWLSPIQPEGASEILYRDTDHARQLAASQAIASTDLRRLGVVDVVVPDRPARGEDPKEFADRVAATAAALLVDISAQDATTRIHERTRRWQHVARQFSVSDPAAQPGGSSHRKRA